MRSLTDILKRVSQEYDPAVFVGLIVAVIVFVVEGILWNKGIIFSGDEKKLEAAKSKGHILRGTMIRYSYNDRDSKGKAGMHVADYEYFVNGKRKKKRIISTSAKPPYELVLYYVDNPNEIFSEYDLGRNPLKVLMYIIPLAMGIITMFLLGFEG